MVPTAPLRSQGTLGRTSPVVIPCLLPRYSLFQLSFPAFCSSFSYHVAISPVVFSHSSSHHGVCTGSSLHSVALLTMPPSACPCVGCILSSLPLLLARSQSGSYRMFATLASRVRRKYPPPLFFYSISAVLLRVLPPFCTQIPASYRGLVQIWGVLFMLRFLFFSHFSLWGGHRLTCFQRSAICVLARLPPAHALYCSCFTVPD